LLLQPNRRYLWVVIKDYGQLQVQLVDVDASVYVVTRLLDTSVGAHETILLSNKDMVINGAANWNANLLTFGVFSYAFADTDVSALYQHYRGVLRGFDPAYVAMQAQLAAASAATACPYDATTCATCGGVTDRTNPLALASAAAPCRAQINSFCAATPSHSRCTCWNLSNPQYNQPVCQSIRGMFGEVQKPNCPPLPPPRPPKPPRRPPSSSSSSSSSSSLTCDVCGDNKKMCPCPKPPPKPPKPPVCPPTPPPPPPPPPPPRPPPQPVCKKGHRVPPPPNGGLDEQSMAPPLQGGATQQGGSTSGGFWSRVFG
jgi:hypothetical protein